MDLFHFQEEAPGSVFWHPKGWTLFQTLENYIRRRQSDAGYAEVNAPQLIDSSMWVASGHMATFRDGMFLVEPRKEDERTYVIKPMNCPGHIQIFKNGLKSYRDLPFKIAEFGKVHRFEPSGALHGLMRVRAFTQDDAHIFITEEQIAAEVLKVNDLILSIYEDFGFADVRIKFSDRPEKRIGEDAVWDKAEAALIASARSVRPAVDAQQGRRCRRKIWRLEDRRSCPDFLPLWGDQTKTRILPRRVGLRESWKCATDKLPKELPARSIRQPTKAGSLGI